jgi:hypothetical protein
MVRAHHDQAVRAATGKKEKRNLKSAYISVDFKPQVNQNLKEAG